MASTFQTHDLYLAATAMTLGMMLTGGSRKGTGRSITFSLEGDEDIWDQAQLAYRNDEPISLPIRTFAQNVRALKNFVHDVE